MRKKNVHEAANGSVYPGGDGTRMHEDPLLFAAPLVDGKMRLRVAKYT